MKIRLACLLLTVLLLAGCDRIEATAPVVEPSRAQVASAPDNAVPAAVGLLLEAISDSRLALVGELHGTRETPALVGDAVERLAAKGETVVLALEIAIGEQPAVDAYLASAGTSDDRETLLASPHWSRPGHDGRDSVAMFDLVEHIRILRTEGGDVALVLFDPDGIGDRDRGMADRLRTLATQHPQARILVLTGNMHAMVAAPAWPVIDGGTPIEPPMTAGRYLHDLDPVSVYVHAAAGEFWACMDDGCKPQTVGGTMAGVLPRLEKQPSGQPWHAILVLPAFTASSPAHPDARGD